MMQHDARPAISCRLQPIAELFGERKPAPQHLSKHRDSDLKPNSGEKAREYRLREKVGDEAEF
jgi:hypothetical protein